MLWHMQKIFLMSIFKNKKVSSWFAVCGTPSEVQWWYLLQVNYGRSTWYMYMVHTVHGSRNIRANIN